jgi:hypothetical protein
MRTQQGGELRLDGSEMSGLNFQQDVVTNDVDHETVDRNFESITWLRIPLFQRCVQRLLVQQSNA